MVTIIINNPSITNKAQLLKRLKKGHNWHRRNEAFPSTVLYGGNWNSAFNTSTCPDRAKRMKQDKELTNKALEYIVQKADIKFQGHIDDLKLKMDSAREHLKSLMEQPPEIFNKATDDYNEARMEWEHAKEEGGKQ